jgi:hypothetical protein
MPAHPKLEAAIPHLQESADTIMGLLAMIRDMDPSSDVDIEAISQLVASVAVMLQSVAESFMGDSMDDESDEEVEQSVEKAGAKMARKRRAQFKQAINILREIATELGIDFSDEVGKSSKVEKSDAGTSWPLDMNELRR